MDRNNGVRTEKMRLLPLAVVAALFISACGGSNSSNDAAADPPPDFGPNVAIFDPSMSVADINSKLQSIAKLSTGFDENRSAVLFMPGTYGSATGQYDPANATGQVDSPIGFMMTVQGLGTSPDDVTINGNLRVGAAGESALDTFWRSLSNLKIVPIEADEPALTMRWSTSQASPIRRVHMMGNLDLTGGLAAGNFIGNSHIEGEVRSGFMWAADANPTTGQVDQGTAEYYTRDSEIGSWQGRAANMVFSGVSGAPQAQFAPGDKTVLATTPVSRDAPFLHFDGKHYDVFVPNARTNSSGFNWGATSSDGVDHPIGDFYIAKSTDTAETINSELSQGKDLILTPGVYKVDQAIHVTRPNTIVMGMGMATITPVNGTAAISVDDVPGVVLSSLLVDANVQNSATLVQVGPSGAHQGQASNPTTLNDVFVRIGGSYAGLATTSFEINQNNVLIDHTWLWRADHGNSGTTGWTVNQADHGLVVNGDNVTALGLFVEHYQKNQVVWNGNGGRTIFVECEAPYDPPTQAQWMNGTQNGFPCYSVANNVTSHSATGFATWTFFMAPSPNVIYAHNVINTPTAANVQFSNITAGVIYGSGGWENIINDQGGAVTTSGPQSFVVGLTAAAQMAAFP